MNNDLSWDKHVNSIISKTVAKMYHFRKFASVIRDTLMCDKMYTSIIRLQMEYAAVVWHWGLKVKDREKLARQEKLVGQILHFDLSECIKERRRK